MSIFVEISKSVTDNVTLLLILYLIRFIFSPISNSWHNFAKKLIK